MIPLFSETELKNAKSRELLRLQCKQCKEEFLKPKNQILAFLKGHQHNTLDFCSKSCQTKNQKKMVDLECHFCGVSFKRQPSQMTGKNSFCSQSCSASFNNYSAMRLKGECLKCGIRISTKRKFCSIECREEMRKTNQQSKALKKDLVKHHYQKLKLKSIEYKGGSCVFCSYNKCVRNLHFHHVEPSKKDFTISGKNWSWEKLRPELDKCILVCGNCHGEIHDGLILQKEVERKMVGLQGIEP